QTASNRCDFSGPARSDRQTRDEPARPNPNPETPDSASARPRSGWDARRTSDAGSPNASRSMASARRTARPVDLPGEPRHGPIAPNPPPQGAVARVPALRLGTVCPARPACARNHASANVLAPELPPDAHCPDNVPELELRTEPPLAPHAPGLLVATARHPLPVPPGNARRGESAPPTREYQA